MNSRIRIKNVVGYLKQKGWKLLYKTSNFNVLESPKELGVQPNNFSIPLEKDEETDYYYDYFMDRFANSIAAFYQLDKNELIKTWSQTPEQLKAEIKEKQAFLDYVS